MCDNILKEKGVALLPGSDFGFNKDKMLMRLSFTDFNGMEFMSILNSKKLKSMMI